MDPRWFRSAKPENLAHVAALLAGADISYDMGVPDGGLLVGRWAPDLVLHTDAGSVRLAELTRHARPHLLDFTGTLSAVAEPWRDRVDVVAAKVVDTSSTALLLRPDCYVAWASTSQQPDELQLRTALTRWFGQPN